MKAFEFMKMFTTLKIIRELHGRPHGQHYQSVHFLIAVTFWYCFRSISRKGIITALLLQALSFLYWEGSKVQIGGPQARGSLSSTVSYKNGIQRTDGGSTLMAGVLLVLMGLFKLGLSIHSLSHHCRFYQWYCRLPSSLHRWLISSDSTLAERKSGDFIDRWMIISATLIQ